MRLYGLIGYPLGHSFSVPYFEQKFEREGIRAIYRNFPLEKMADFENLVKQHPELQGLNVTVPYKEQVIPYLDALSDTAREVGAVNTICFCRKKGILGRIGHNTDVPGFERSLKEHLKEIHGSALVLGSGGASKAVTHVLSRMGIDFRMVSRSPGEGRITYGELDHHRVARNKLIVNTTPLGMYPDVGSMPPIPYEALTPEHLLFDLVYNPARTLFLEKGESMGAHIVNGYDMLVYQAEGSWDIWNREDRQDG